MKLLAKTVYRGIMLDVWEWIDRSSEEQKAYLSEMKYLVKSEPLHNEMQKIKNAAGSAIVRTTKTDEQVAWNRGILHGMETLEKRIKELSTK